MKTKRFGLKKYIKEIMSSPVVTIADFKTLKDASVKLNQHKIGSIVVVSGKKPVGIITEEDITKCVATNIELSKLCLEVMQTRITLGSPNTTITEASVILNSGGYGRMLIMDGMKLMGIVTETDIEKALLEESLMHEKIKKCLEDKNERNKHFLDVFEQRNKAFRILYDTIVGVDDIADDLLYPFICRNLRKICDGKSAAIATYDSFSSNLTLRAYESKVTPKSKPHLEVFDDKVKIIDDLVNDFKDNKILVCRKHNKCLVGLFSNFVNLASSKNQVCYRVSCVRDGNLIALGFVQLGQGDKMKLKDLVDLYLNLVGIIIQRRTEIKIMNKSQLELKERNEELEKFNQFAIDRELKMIELKEEIERLKGENDEVL